MGKDPPFELPADDLKSESQKQKTPAKDAEGDAKSKKSEGKPSEKEGEEAKSEAKPEEPPKDSVSEKKPEAPEQPKSKIIEATQRKDFLTKIDSIIDIDMKMFGEFLNKQD